MQREIICPDCNTERLAHLGFPTVDTPLGPRLAIPIGPEYHRVIKGASIRTCQCDRCGREIESGQEAFAVSIWIDKTQEDYRWEAEYIKEEQTHG